MKKIYNSGLICGPDLSPLDFVAEQQHVATVQLIYWSAEAFY